MFGLGERPRAVQSAKLLCPTRYRTLRELRLGIYFSLPTVYLMDVLAMLLS